MHELSIADAVRAIAERHANGRTVTRVELRIGHLRQVVPSSLEFAWELVTQGTTLDGAELLQRPSRRRSRSSKKRSIRLRFIGPRREQFTPSAGNWSRILEATSLPIWTRS